MTSPAAPSTPNASHRATIHESVAAQASLRPEAVAVVCDGNSITYRELNRRANQVAHHLQRLGAKENTLVALATERSIDMIVGLLGILKSGAAYLPIDPTYPRERLEFMLADAAPLALLTTSSCRPSLPACAAAVVLLDGSTFGLASESADNPTRSTPAESLAYVIYTSGSTGQPKGCQITHANVMRLFSSTDPWFGFGRDDVWTFFHSPAFDFSVWEIWGALVHGGRVVVVPYMVSRSPNEFHKLLVRERVTVLNQTPSAFRALSEADALSNTAPDALSLRYVIFGGEALEPHMLRPWFDRHGDARPRLVNMYGITETTVHVTYRPIRRADLENRSGSVIGQPIPDLAVWVLDADLRPVPAGTVGEMFVGGAGVCRGYLNRRELTAERFIEWTPPGGGASVRLYRTGDLGRRLPDGDLEYQGRIDHQVKLRGFRIETGEIESQLSLHPGVGSCVVIARTDGPGGETRLVAYIVPSASGASHAELRQHLALKLPDFMVPSAFVSLGRFPITENGKLDRKALPAPSSERPDLEQPFLAPANEVERSICAIFADLLELDRVGARDNFFELGGSSLLAVQALEAISRRIGHELSVAAIFDQPTAVGLARCIEADAATAGAPLSEQGARGPSADHDDPIAVIGMAGRFPGASTVETFWANLLQGRDTITAFSEQTLDPSIPTELRNDPDYVRARGIIAGIEDFDAAFFAIPPREAEVTDPQHRVFLEIAWECLERAGYAPDAMTQSVGVFAGVGTPAYLQQNVHAHPDAIERVGELQVQIANDKDYVATRVAYKLNLKGPALNVNTACSTSLVAIAHAVDSLRLGRCAMALAGAASVASPPNSGYLYQDGAMLSKDGHTRTFDVDAQGTTFSDGAAVVLLKRLSRALADGDQVFALIRGVATNNDGGGKASFTAPSVEGQADVIAAAHIDAGIEPGTITYVEAHGTATPLGDPVEVEGLTRAFRRRTAEIGFCRLGSVKSNVGHLITAAGAAGLIKTALSLSNEQLPASIHFVSANPKIDFANSPFVVNHRLTSWPRGQQPRRAGVSSFGVGGTNAHVVLEEAPRREPSSEAAGVQLLLLSAKSRPALDSMAARLADHLDAHPQVNLADVAHTLQFGRSRFAHRLCVVAGSAVQASAALRAADDPRRALRTLGAAVPALVWLFPGQGAQYAGMGKGLYEHDAAFRAAFDECCAALRDVLSFDLKAKMFDGGAAALVATGVTQPATFCLEYALAQAWLARGARPAAFIGHSVGEFVAAVLAGVMSLPDAARLVAQRGAMMQEMPSGSMLSVRMPLDKLLPQIPAGLSLAAENGPSACVVAGPTPAVEAWRAQLEADGVAARMLQTSHAFHSSMLDPVVAPFESRVRTVKLSAPKLPIVSTLTGTWMTAEEATDPHYWARHLREPVRFSKAVRAALARQDSAFLEIGPRGTLATLARQHSASDSNAAIAVASLGDAPETEVAALALARGQLWTLGIELPAAAASPPTGRRRVLLPTYPFERKRFWMEARPSAPRAASPVPAVSAPATAESFATGILPSISMPTAMPSPASPDMSRPRRAQLETRLRALFEDVAGVDLGGADASANFVELGLDSLTLTQTALQVKKQFNVSITFRQLMQQYANFEKLAAFIDAALPPEPVAVEPQANLSAASSPPPPHGSSAAGNGLVQQVLAQQMQMMQMMAQQLAALGGAAIPQVATSATPAVAASQSGAATNGSKGEAVRYDVKKAFGAIARIHTHSSEVTEHQRARLGAFMRRYIERTKKSKAFTAEHRPHLADPRVVNGFRPLIKEITYQIVIERSKGSKMWDIDGNEYVDVLSGFGMNLFGWQPEFVTEAVRKQLDAGYEIGPQHALAGEVARLVCELTGCDRAGLCNTGSEAVMAAVRIARTVTGRDTVVLFTGSYHGTFDEVLVRAGRGGKGIPAAPGIMSGMFGDVRVLDYGTPEALEFIRSNADELAAVLVEPVQSRRPDFQPQEFLREVRAITEASGTCLIFDEVITGFRSHPGGTQAMFGVRADLATYGKVIGGGFPIGVVAGKRNYMDALDGGAWQYGDDSIPTVGVTYFAGTFVRHPLALAAAHASLEHLKKHSPRLQLELNQHTAAMAAELNAFFCEVGAPLEIRYFTSLWRVSWLEDHPLQDLLFAMMRSRGVHILDNFPCFLTTAHSPADIQRIVTAFKESVRELQESDFLPRAKGAATVGFDSTRPPVPGARLGKDADGNPAWFVRSPQDPSKYVKMNA